MQVMVSVVEPDACRFVCFSVVCHLETEQPFLACSLGHLAAEVMGPMATASLSSENRGNVIRKWIWTEERVLGQEDEQHFLRWVSLYTRVPGEQDKCSILEMLY